MPFCRDCGTQLSETSRFCPSCGAPNRTLIKPAVPPNVYPAFSPATSPRKKSPAAKLLTAFVTVVLTATVVIILAVGYNKLMPGESPSANTGSIKTGSAVSLSNAKIEATGGTITINKPGDPLDGMQVTIPDGAYPASKQFKVSYAPVESHTFGANFNPVTPMITVDNGGDYSADVILIDVPVKVPAGSFAMGFMYDPVSKKLEGMTTVSQDADSITLATLHFSSFVLSSIAETLLQSDVDSGFRPGVDDWKLPNEGSALVAAGNCSGMSDSAMWYYVTKPDGKDVHLYGRYDNNGNQPATPNFWRDDSLAYRFVSVCQLDYMNPFASTQLGNFQDWLYRNIKSLRGYDDALNYNLFAYSMKMTGEPQYASISSNLGGHAMVCYRISGGKLFIADPNFCGDTERRITYANRIFAPYTSGNVVFNKIGYMAKNVSSDWNKIAQRWTEFKNKTIGTNEYPLLRTWRGLYYSYSGWWDDDSYSKADWKPVTEGMVFTSNKVGFMAAGDTVVRPLTFRDSVNLPWDGKMMVELKPGANLLGFEILSNDEYVDFQYYNVTCNVPTAGLTVKPASQEAVPNQTITFDLELKSAAPSGSHFEWFVDGVFKQKDGFGINVSFPAPGTHTITAKLVDASDKVLAEAQGTAVVKAPASTTAANNLALLQKMKTFYGNFAGQCNIKEKTGLQTFLVPMPNSAWKPSLAITWNGASFSGTNIVPIEGGTETNTVSGTFSADGKTLVSITFTFSQRTTVTGGSGVVTHDDSATLQLKNIPVGDLAAGANFQFIKSGPEVQSYLVKYEQHMLTNMNGVPFETTYLANTIAWNATGMFDMPRLSLMFTG